MTNAQLLKLVLDLVVKIHVENPIQMYVVPEQTVKWKITNLFVHVPEVSPEIHSNLVENLLNKICVTPILVVQEQLVNLEMIDLVATDQYVLALKDIEEIH